MEVDFFELSGDVWYLQAAALNCLITKATRKTKTRGALGYTRNRKTEEKIIQNRRKNRKTEVF